MARIILITAANRKAGERQREWTLGYKPLQWCRDNLRLESEPISLQECITLIPNPSYKGGNQCVFVKVDKNEKSPLTPGVYLSSRSGAEVKELLRDELRPATSAPSSTFGGIDESNQKPSIEVLDIAKPFPKLIHHPGRIEQIFQDGKEVLIGLPLCGNSNRSPVAGNSDGITTTTACKECQSIARESSSPLIAVSD